MTPDRDNSELLLTAFRYVSGELPAGEAANFETLLASDQSARDALADVVELSEAVAVEEFERFHTQPYESVAGRTRRALPRWGVVAAVAVVAVACFLVLNNGDQPDRAGGPDVASQATEAVTVPVEDGADSVLSLWSELGWDNADLFESDAFLAEDVEPLSPDKDEIPDWLLTAVVGDEDETGADNMPDDMRELMDELDQENL